MSRRYERQCNRKFRHDHYLSALHHAMQLSDENIVIYPCGICDGLHLGHEVIRKSGDDQRRREQIAFLQHKIARLRVLIVQHQEKAGRLSKEVERLLVRRR